jgi:hypothetical protein
MKLCVTLSVRCFSPIFPKIGEKHLTDRFELRISFSFSN